MSSAKVFQIAFQLGASVNSSVRTAFANTNRNLSDVKKNTEELNKKSGMLTKGMKGLGAAALAASAILATGLGTALSQFDDFNSSIQQVQASTGATAKEIAEIKKVSTNLYNQNLGEDWDDLANAISAAKSVTQLSGKELEKATSNALVYRDVWGEEVNESIKATDTMMRNFGISSTEAYNLMAQGAQKGLNKSDELIDSANEYAPYFASLGFNANEMFDVFSTGLKNGAFNLDKVGDSVKEFNIRSKDGSKASAEAYQALGMDAEKMTQIFARGGPEAQKSFSEVVNAIKNVKDPAEQNAIAVGLFGTQAEDLEMKVLTSLGNVKSQFDMTKNTMEDVKNIKYDTLGNAIKGIGRQIQTGFLIPIGDKLLPVMQNFSDWARSSMPGIKQVFSQTFSSLGSIISGAFSVIGPVFSSLWSAAVPALKQVGTIAISIFQKISDFWSQNGAKILSAYSNIFKVGQSIFNGVVKVVQAILPIIQPILSNVVGFIMNLVGQVSAFWNENGAQIISAVQNVFSGISAIISFLAPVILFIVNTIWGNVKGLIQGALNVIMGLIKVFAGLFTGDFAKMWEGAKQLFFGAIQVIWNYVNLLFVGKILGGVKALVTGSIGKISGMWTSIKGFFSGGATAAWTKVTEMGSKLTSTFSTIKTKVVDIAKSIWSGVKNQFSNIVQGATSLPGKIGAGIKSMAGKAVSGAISMGNKLLSGIGKIVNGVIKGLNWTMGKLGIDTTINEWEVPQYAKGTNGHPGGLAIVGEQGPELFRTPDGRMGLTPGRDTLVNLPAGTEVLPHRQSMQMMMNNIPAYKDGIGSKLKGAASWLGGKAVDAGKWVAGKANGATKAVKNVALDVWNYVSDPKALMSKLLEKFGVTVPDFTGAVGQMAKGVFNKVKDGGLDFLKDKLSSFGNWSGAGAAAPEQVRSWVMQALSITNTPMSWLPAMLVKAQKESGYNPKAINLWDSNAKKGTPSKGLFQTIDPTFNAYKMKGMNDIYNPIHNAVAAIRYIKSRYGSVFNTPGIKSMARGGAYKGYYEGGNVPNTQWAWVGEQGPELMKIPGGSRVYSNGESQGMLSGLLSYSKQPDPPKSPSANDSRSVEINYNPNIVIQGNADENVLMAALRSGHAEFKEMVKQALQDLNDDKNRLSFN